MTAIFELNQPTSLSGAINKLIEVSLQDNHAQQPPREYLGASRLGVPCARALQYEYTHVPRDQKISGQTLRIFELGHAIESMALRWLEGAGFTIETRRPDGAPFGFSLVNGRIKGHVDGIVRKPPAEIHLACPALWECKSMNARAWKQTVEKGIKIAKPVYAVQVALYQAYMEDGVPGISQNPALMTLVNKDTAELHHELLPFEGALAQEASDRGVNILQATQAGEILPRISTNPNSFDCRFCDWRNSCWKEAY